MDAQADVGREALDALTDVRCVCHEDFSDPETSAVHWLGGTQALTLFQFHSFV